MKIALVFTLGFLAADAHSNQELKTRDATLPELCAQWQEDLGALQRLYPYPLSQARTDAFARLHREWEEKLNSVDFPALSRDAQIDWLLLHRDWAHKANVWKFDGIDAATAAPYLDHAQHLVPLLEANSRRERPDPRAASEALHAATQNIETWQAAWKEETKDNEEGIRPNPTHMRLASRTGDRLRRAVANWYRYRAEYDPEFTWWCKTPWEELDKAMKDHGQFLEKTVAGVDLDDPELLLGQPIGRERLLTELLHERIAFSPEKLVEIAEKEFAWCDQKREAAATAMGLDGDWRAAQEAVRNIQVAPGDQPDMILELALEAERYFEERELMTIPQLAKDTWRMQMMSPERQRFSPYFTGGEVISISYPTEGMGHEAKLQSMRGNNRHFSRAVVHHELIPGHHLQGYMARRWAPHRSFSRTAFLTEGWALYWELRLWDMGFATGPEDEIGMLFWRSHRSARILFSLNFHLGKWTPEECADFLVERVGHDRRNATAEVRRSIQGGYGPLYQIAYLIGGLQFRDLHREMVAEGPLGEKDFHDSILQQGSIPIDWIRRYLQGTPLTPADAGPSTWRFYKMD